MLRIHPRTIRDSAHLLAGSWGLLWWFFPSQTAAVALCLAVTAAVTLVFGLARFSKIAQKISDLVAFEDELFLGLVLYALSFTLITFFLWDQKPIGTAAILVLALGDGAASIVGHRFSFHPYQFFYNKQKSVEGSFACFLFSFLGIFIGLSLGTSFPASLVLSLLAGGVVAAVEAASPPHTDNLTIPLAVVLFLKFLRFYFA